MEPADFFAVKKTGYFSSIYCKEEKQNAQNINNLKLSQT